LAWWHCGQVETALAEILWDERREFVFARPVLRFGTAIVSVLTSVSGALVAHLNRYFGPPPTHHTSGNDTTGPSVWVERKIPRHGFALLTSLGVVRVAE
jgi:hypothetical protein